jgi:hypothetical protein
VAHLPGVPELLEFMLVRDPARRPTLGDALARCARRQLLYKCALPGPQDLT